MTDVCHAEERHLHRTPTPLRYAHSLRSGLPLCGVREGLRAFGAVQVSDEAISHIARGLLRWKNATSQ